MKKLSIICIVTLTLALALGLFTISSSADTPHSHDNITYTTEWSGSVAGGNISGNIVLTGNVTLTGQVTVENGTSANLCLNGYTLTMEGYNRVLNAATMTICDCSSEKTGKIAAVKVGNDNAVLQTTGALTLNAVTVQNLRVWDGGGSAKLIGNTVLESTISPDFDAYVSGYLDVSEYTGEAITIDYGNTIVPVGYTLFVGTTDTEKFKLYDTSSGCYLVASGNNLVTAHNHIWVRDICSGCDAVNINANNFPDSTFRTYVSDSFDADDDGALSLDELAAVTVIDVIGKGISNLKGVEHFTELTELYATNNSLTSIDLSKNTKLNHLSIFRNQLTSIDLSKNTGLVRFYADTNKLQSLDLSNNPLLIHVECHFNELSSITFSDNSQIKSLHCHYNNLTSLDLSGLTGLEKLTCQNNNLTSLKLADGVALENFTGNNQTAGITVVKPLPFDMKSLNPSFDPNRVTFTTEGVSLNGTNLVISGNPTEIAYTYATGSSGHSIEVTLGVTVIDLIGDIEKLEEDLDKAVKDLNDAISKKADAETVNNAIERLTSAYEAADQAIGELRNTDTELLRDVEALQTALANAEATLIAAINELRGELSKAVEDLQITIGEGDAALDEKIVKLDEEYRAADALLNSKIAELRIKDASIKSSIEALGSATAEAQAALQAAIDKLSLDLENAKTELSAAISSGDAALDEKLAALDFAYKAADALLDSDIIALQGEDTEIKANAEELRASLADTKAALEKSITDLRAELTAADKALDEKKANADLTYALIAVVGVVALGGNACWIALVLKKKKD